MEFFKKNYKLTLKGLKVETGEEREERERRNWRVIKYGAGVIFGLVALLGVYITATEGIFSEDFLFFTITTLVLIALSFLCFSPWRRSNFLVSGILVSAVGVWMFVGLLDYQHGDFWYALIWTIGIGLWGAALLARAVDRTLTGIVKDFFEMDAVKTTGNLVKYILKLALWAGLAGLVAWLIVALGPLWIIAIILLLILFVLANK